jgi:hypothetical protein
MSVPKPVTLAIILIFIGVVFFVLMFFNLISDIALAVAGAGFILSGFLQLGLARYSKQKERQLQQLMAKLEEIQQEIKNVDKQKDKGVIIADVLNSGLKYYAEHMTKSKREDQDD